VLSILGENPAILGNRTLTLMFNQPLSSMGLQGRGNRAHITALPVGPAQWLRNAFNTQLWHNICKTCPKQLNAKRTASQMKSALTLITIGTLIFLLGSEL